MRPTLGAFTYAYNMLKYDYPFEESVRSVIDIVDQFVICDCKSDDGTADLIEKLRLEFPDKIKVVRRNWVMHFSEISAVANFAMDALDTDYAFQLQADEVVHHESLFELATLPQKMEEEKLTGARVHYTHFMANYETTFPFCYEALVRIVKRGTPWHIIGDGVQFAYTDQQIPEDKVKDTSIRVFHYGKVKDPVKGWQKEWDFQQLYVDIGFPDPKMMEMVKALGSKKGEEKVDYVYLFENHVQQGTIKKFTGTHPVAMLPRIAAFRVGGYEQFVSMVKSNLKINFEGKMNAKLTEIPEQGKVQEAIAALKNDITTHQLTEREADYAAQIGKTLKTVILEMQFENQQGWETEFAFTWGEYVRNRLRKLGYGELALHIGNLNDYFMAFVEEVLNG